MTQRSKLEQVRLNRVGLKSLAEPSVAETLSLSEGQREQIAAIIGNRVAVLREVGASRVDAEIQNRLRKVLTNAQYATWQVMAGGGNAASPSDMVVPSEKGPGDTASQPQQTSEVAAQEQVAAPESPVNVPAADNERSAIATTSAEQPQRASSEEDEPKLVINFNGADWGTVLKWIANEAELSLQLDTIPTGTFTYRDPRKYSTAQAMDIMNGVLLGKGYTLVRRQRTLLVIDLGSGESADVTRGLIRELAQLVVPQQLDDRGEFELLKCIFVLSRLTPEEAKQQIELLIGPQGSVIPLASASQILVVETGGKLRLIRDIIERAENPDVSQSTKIATIQLRYVTAEEVLSIARSHLGIEEDGNKAEGITVSTDTFGTTIYASGSASKIQILREIVTKMDVAPSGDQASNVQVQPPLLRMHPIYNADPQTVMNVLQTMLAGLPNVRLGLDETSKSIVAQAPPAEQQLIENTLAELGGNATVFEIIPLTRLDPKTAIATLEKLILKKSDSSGSTTSASSSDGPVLYGDTYAKTLMVKGTKQQVEQVKGIIQEIEKNGPSLNMLGDRVRFYPGSASPMIE